MLPDIYYNPIPRTYKISPAVFEHMEPHLNTILGQSARIQFNQIKNHLQTFFVSHVGLLGKGIFTEYGIYFYCNFA